MTFEAPDINEIESRIVGLYEESELATFATVSPDNKPHASCMHFVSDGTKIYTHTFQFTRKYEYLLQNPAISMELRKKISGFENRMELQAIQMNGIASFVEDQAEVDRVLELSYAKHEWLQEFDLFAPFKQKNKELRQLFIRIDPVEALYADNTVRFGWRTMVDFDEQGHVVSMAPYRGDIRA